MKNRLLKTALIGALLVATSTLGGCIVAPYGYGYGHYAYGGGYYGPYRYYR